MGIDIDNGYNELRHHVGHKVVCTAYGGNIQNVAVECETCGMVLYDYDKPETDATEDVTVYVEWDESDETLRIEVDRLAQKDHFAKTTVLDVPEIHRENVRYLQVKDYTGFAEVVSKPCRTNNEPA